MMCSAIWSVRKPCSLPLGAGVPIAVRREYCNRVWVVVMGSDEARVSRRSATEVVLNIGSSRFYFRALASTLGFGD